ncbi:hypothetical protein F5144DRAFT_561514 [Chaetomium tenue]|uniref:Uncharacterized protein n=1 Tax=Chaetomium tenue TaxID=1854479 RepID=A0ACB7PL00_9PEZI|nr:hypothetical protein F5144DRAFT_561514 [Chaetomium globosum]
MPRNGAAPSGGFRSVKSAHRIKESTCFDPSTRLAAEGGQETVASRAVLVLLAARVGKLAAPCSQKSGTRTTRASEASMC